MIDRMRRGVLAAAAAGVAILGLATAATAAVKYESRTVSVTTTTLPPTKVELDGKVTSKHAVQACYARVPVRLDKRRPDGSWATIRSGRTDPKGAFSWTIVGFKARARIVVPQVKQTGLQCAPVILGFDRGYLSPG